LRSGENRKEQCRRRLSAIARCGDDAERAPSYPATASFVAERETPTAAADDLSGRAPAVCDGARARDEKNSRPVVESIVHRDQAIGVDDDLFGELLRVERRMERSTLLVAAGAGDAAVENARKHRARLCDLRKGARHQLRDDVRRALGLSGRHG